MAKRGRKSALSDARWDELIARALSGVPRSELSKKYGVSLAVICRHMQKVDTADVKHVAQELAALPVRKQEMAIKLANEMRAISEHLSQGALYGAATAHRLQALAHNEVQKIPDVDPLASMNVLRGVVALSQAANTSSEMGMKLLQANKDAQNDKSAAVPLVLNGSDVHG